MRTRRASCCRVPDRATREVKSRGRNDIGWYLHSLEQVGRGRIEMVTGLHKAIEREELRLPISSPGWMCRRPA